MLLVTQQRFFFLEKALNQIVRGDPVTVFSVPPGNASFTQRGRVQSPRLRPSSPSTPPCSPNVKIASPRSPRRSYNSKNAIKQLNGKVSLLGNYQTSQALLLFPKQIYLIQIHNQISRTHLFVEHIFN